MKEFINVQKYMAMIIAITIVSIIGIVYWGWGNTIFSICFSALLGGIIPVWYLEKRNVHIQNSIAVDKLCQIVDELADKSSNALDEIYYTLSEYVEVKQYYEDKNTNIYIMRRCSNKTKLLYDMLIDCNKKYDEYNQCYRRVKFLIKQVKMQKLNNYDEETWGFVIKMWGVLGAHLFSVKIGKRSFEYSSDRIREELRLFKSYEYVQISESYSIPRINIMYIISKNAIIPLTGERIGGIDKIIRMSLEEYRCIHESKFEIDCALDIVKRKLVELPVLHELS